MSSLTLPNDATAAAPSADAAAGAPAQPVRPFVIWTLQRTGGTNLTRQLVRLSGLPRTEHEPFNEGRAYGHVTAAWRKDRDALAMGAAMQEIAAEHQVIKHCVEMVPPEINGGLALATAAAGYQHVFLYRRQPKGRLLSLHYARVSGIWGNRMKTGQPPTEEELRRHPLPVPELVERERRGMRALQRVWDGLVEMGAHPLAIAYEDLYQSPPARSQHVLQRLFDELGFRFPPRRLPHIWEQVVGQGDQGTRSAYAAFGGQEALDVALARWRGFRPVPSAAALLTSDPQPPSAWVAAAHLHGAGAAVPRRRRLDGTVVCAAAAPAGLRLVLADAHGEHPVVWGLRSGWTAEQHPGLPQAAFARFVVPGYWPEGAATLWAEDPATGMRQAVLRIEGGAPEAAAVVAEALRLKPGGGPEDTLWAQAVARWLEQAPPGAGLERRARAIKLARAAAY
ncbi:hypothetical protein [Ideonella sp.]|uniref:hypothetical protein n=1 Tax=Ideonella sp. TaxID=1929293 RepID=UPI0035B487BD